MTRDPASTRQVQAADPAASSWVTANAGSGKTRVLTDRVARLLLAGCPPQRILCLTYTRAAAAEMQNRLFAGLGEWAMLPDAALARTLERLGAAPQPAGLDGARRLFARAIEAPGGLRLQTIHGFCAALLRRFPLEAGVSPAFAEMDERSGELLRAAVLEAMADGPQAPLVADLARHLPGEGLAALADEIARHRAALDPPADEAAIARALGVPAGLTEAALVARVLTPAALGLIAALVPVLAQGSVADAKAAARLALLRSADAAALAELEDLFLFGAAAKAPFTAKLNAFPTRDTRTRLGALLGPLEDLLRAVEAARPLRLGLDAAARTGALHRFAGAFLPALERAKAARGWLDFDDLILRARALLGAPGVAEWVLWRLDGGIDHILVDEAQDTSPAQWAVIERLAAEMLAGEGARSGRTLFVVGDRKQSIYSFQGADLAAFDTTGERFARALAASGGGGLVRLDLEHSFRSAPAVLRAVDLTFDDRAGRGIGGPMHHIAFREDLPGRVDLWPPVPPAAAVEPAAWFDPLDLPRAADPPVVLAGQIAAAIRGWLDAGEQVPARDGPRRLRPGDILILVQRRSALFAEIIRACKAAGLPMAGADRLRLGAELAVRDIAALLAFLDLPEDDLQLACALRSPLCGWDEAELHALARPRAGYLWAALRGCAATRPATLAMLTDLRDAAEYLRPYELIERILIRHDGRRRLIARLGPEAEDGIDQLLSQALAFERIEVPSLTAFLAWLATDDVEARRQMDAASDRIRVMTVHGAKGLEAPVVILPDAADRDFRDDAALAVLPGGLVAWKGTIDAAPPALAAARATARAAWEAEQRRLLYVAMTRAQSWLIVAAAGKAEGASAWHAQVRAGLEAAGAVAAGFPTGRGLRLATGEWPAPDLGALLPAGPACPAPDPPPPAPAAPAVPLRSPSALGGAAALPGGGDEGEAARRHGTAVHRLLEVLPRLPPARRAGAAATLAAEAPDPAAATAEALGVLADPALAHLFAPDVLAEAPLAATVGGMALAGTIDRLAVGPDRVLAVDFKTNRVLPDRPEDVPEGILRQMGAYAALLGALYPGRAVATALVWTRAPRLMPLPAALVLAALRRAQAD